MLTIRQEWQKVWQNSKHWQKKLIRTITIFRGCVGNEHPYNLFRAILFLLTRRALLPQTFDLRIDLLFGKTFEVHALRRTNRHARSTAHAQTRIHSCRPFHDIALTIIDRQSLNRIVRTCLAARKTRRTSLLIHLCNFRIASQHRLAEHNHDLCRRCRCLRHRLWNVLRCLTRSAKQHSRRVRLHRSQHYHYTIMELDEFVRVEGKIIPCNILYLCYGISTKAKGKESCQRSN